MITAFACEFSTPPSTRQVLASSFPPAEIQTAFTHRPELRSPNYHDLTILLDSSSQASRCPHSGSHGVAQDGTLLNGKPAVGAQAASPLRIVSTRLHCSTSTPLDDTLTRSSAGLKQACPEGMFVSLTPGDPTVWSAVLFIRYGEMTRSIGSDVADLTRPQAPMRQQSYDSIFTFPIPTPDCHQSSRSPLISSTPSSRL